MRISKGSESSSLSEVGVVIVEKMVIGALVGIGIGRVIRLVELHKIVWASH